MLDTLSDLDALICSNNHLIIIDSVEEKRLLEHIKEVSSEQGPVHIWSAGNGLMIAKNNLVLENTIELDDALRTIKGQKDGVYVFLDVKPFLDKPEIQRLLKDIINSNDKKSVIIIDDGLEVPVDLKRRAATFIPKLPDGNDIEEIYYEEVFRWLSARRGRRFKRPADSDLEHLFRTLGGLNEEDVRHLISLAIDNDGAITPDDFHYIIDFKKSVSDQGGLVEFSEATIRLSDVGGLEHLKEWLSLRKEAFLTEKDDMSIDPSKGILLLGVQGSGKSLAAKAISGEWDVPLIRLDFGSLYNKWIGETEHNIKIALEQANALAPCVLWVDEIEKGVVSDSTSDSDGGLSRRVLATLLTWMSERKNRVFLVATANDVSRLPPELLRKGRFDEIFFVDLPKEGVRRDIFKIHLEKRKKKSQLFNLKELAIASEGYSGSEIEQAIIGGMYIALGRHEALNTNHILEEMRKTQPLSVVMREKIDALRSWAFGRTVPADA